MRLRATSTALAALVVVGLSGCTFTAPQTNQTPYDPSDGFGADIGDLDVRNAILISEDGETGNLTMDVVNSGEEDVELLLSWEAEDGRTEQILSIPAGETQSLGDEDNRLVLEGIDAPLGSLFPVYFQYGDVEGEEVDVPVLDGQLEEYSGLVPEVSPTSPTTPPTPAGSSSPSPSTSRSASPAGSAPSASPSED